MQIGMTAFDPMGGFVRGVELAGVLQARRQAEQQAQAQMQEQEVLRQALAEYGRARTPAEQVAVMERYPALAKPISDKFNALDEATRKPIFDAGLKGYSLLMAGDAGGAARVWRETGAAFQNSNRAELARQFLDMADKAESNPDIIKNAASATLAAIDPKRFKEFGDAVGRSDLTSFQKDLEASGIDPQSDQGKQLARQYVQNRVDPIVTMETPSGAQFIGPMSEYQKRYGAAPQGAQRLPVVATKEQYDAVPSGSRFLYNGAIVRKP